MKKLLLILVTLVAFDTVHAACRIKIRAPKISPDQETTNFILYKNGTWSGLTVDLTTALLEEAGCEYSIHQMPWKRALADLEDGHIDIMANLSFTKEREKFAYYIGPMNEEKMVLIVKKKSQYQIKTLDDFKRIPANFSMERGVYLGKAFDQKLKSDAEFRKKFSLFSGGDITNYERLALGRIGGFIADNFEASTHLKKYQQLIVHPFTINHDWVFWGVSRKSVAPDNVLNLYQAYVRLKNRKALEAIINRYKNK